ncbi:hypothetical protein FRB94_010077 [Tulasnella sp. JGI-2019a]|nr:hypothetical protein FRB94_010077 [Tulasnella sp. JGI-2019a]
MPPTTQPHGANKLLSVCNAELETELAAMRAELSKTSGKSELLIPHPAGEQGKNWKLQDAMKLMRNKPLYNKIMHSVHSCVDAALLDMKLCISQQDPGRLYQCLQAAKNHHPYLQKFDQDWPVCKFLKQTMSNSNNSNDDGNDDNTLINKQGDADMDFDGGDPNEEGDDDEEGINTSDDEGNHNSNIINDLDHGNNSVNDDEDGSATNSNEDNDNEAMDHHNNDDEDDEAMNHHDYATTWSTAKTRSTGIITKPKSNRAPTCTITHCPVMLGAQPNIQQDHDGTSGKSKKSKGGQAKRSTCALPNSNVNGGSSNGSSSSSSSGNSSSSSNDSNSIGGDKTTTKKAIQKPMLKQKTRGQAAADACKNIDGIVDLE